MNQAAAAAADSWKVTADSSLTGIRSVAAYQVRLGARAGLACLVVASAVVRSLVAVSHAAPSYFPDEYIYARSGPIPRRERKTARARRGGPLPRPRRALAGRAALGARLDGDRVSPDPDRERPADVARSGAGLSPRPAPRAQRRVRARLRGLRARRPRSVLLGFRHLGSGRLPARARRPLRRRRRPRDSEPACAGELPLPRGGRDSDESAVRRAVPGVRRRGDRPRPPGRGPGSRGFRWLSSLRPGRLWSRWGRAGSWGTTPPSFTSTSTGPSSGGDG